MSKRSRRNTVRVPSRTGGSGWPFTADESGLLWMMLNQMNVPGQVVEIVASLKKKVKPHVPAPPKAAKGKG